MSDGWRCGCENSEEYERAEEGRCGGEQVDNKYAQGIKGISRGVPVLSALDQSRYSCSGGGVEWGVSSE